MGFIHEKRPSGLMGCIGAALDDLLMTMRQLRLVTVFGWPGYPSALPPFCARAILDYGDNGRHDRCIGNCVRRCA